MEIKSMEHATLRTQIRFYGDGVTEQDFDGKVGSMIVLYNSDKTNILVGLGDNPSVETARDAVMKGIAKAIELKRDAVAIEIPDILTREQVAEYVVRASYTFDKYKSEKPHKLNHVELFGNEDNTDVERGAYRGECINYARDLQNDNSNVIDPEYLLGECIKLDEEYEEFDLSYLEGDAIAREGFGLLEAVGRGSHLDSKMIVLSYVGDENVDEYTAIVGKGITFDSGGHSLKPSDSMLDMRMDMSGAGAVLGFMKYIAKYGSNDNILAVIPTCHNAISSKAFNVGDVVKSYSGKTVEIHNTDAEGRLILADALSYVIKNYDVERVVDLATLTGAIVVALGENCAGMFTNEKTNMDEHIFEAGERVGERVWKMPLRDEHRDAMKGTIADLRNMSNIGRNCGSTTAAAFLEKFVEDKPWVHLDIAGTAMNKKQGGTGFGVNLLIEWLCD